eukprot:COSAG05_NODE_23028_length_261_cov_0.290123_1_plen_49_part_10
MGILEVGVGGGVLALVEVIDKTCMPDVYLHLMRALWIIFKRTRIFPYFH